MTVDLYAQFPGVSWRGIPFPVTSLRNGFGHAHVEHYFVYRDGCHIEATGRNARNFHARIPFHNGVQASPLEQWAGQQLFPTLFNRFLLAVEDRSTGELLHPTYGPLQCKTRDVDWTYQAGTGVDGATIDVSWYETTDSEDINGTIAQQAPMAQAISNADKLDSALTVAKTKDPLPELANDTTPFGTLIRNFQGGTGNLGRIDSKLDNTSLALDRLNSVNFWELRTSTEDMRAAVYDLKSNPSQGGKTIKTFTIGNFGTTLPLLSISLGVRTDDLVRLNPKLANDPRVPPGTKVKYFGVPGV